MRQRTSKDTFRFVFCCVPRVLNNQENVYGLELEKEKEIMFSIELFWFKTLADFRRDTYIYLFTYYLLLGGACLNTHVKVRGQFEESPLSFYHRELTDHI